LGIEIAAEEDQRELLGNCCSHENVPYKWFSLRTWSDCCRLRIQLDGLIAMAAVPKPAETSEEGRLLIMQLSPG
jgi:hypothetical protein